MNAAANRACLEAENLALKQKIQDQETLIKNHQLIWQNAPENPRKTFSHEQIQKIFEVIESSDFYNMGKEGTGYHHALWPKWLRSRDKCITACIYLLALRPKEACSLRFEDIDFNNGIITIRGQNNKEGNGRIVPIPRSLLIYLKEYLSQPQHIWGNTPYFFPSFSDRLRPLSASTWKGRFRRILKEANIWIPPIGGSKKASYSSYTLRHTRATEILIKEKDIFMVSNILGHKNVRSTQSYLADYKVSKTYFEAMREAMQGSQNAKQEFLEI